MQLSIKTLAAAAVFAVAGQASAALSEGLATGDNGGTLFLSVWDSVAQVSYTRDLGIAFNSFLPNSVTTLAADGGGVGDKTPAAGLGPLSFAGDALFASTFGASSAANIRWSIFAQDDAEDPTLGRSRMLTTVTGSAGGVTNGGLRSAIAALSGNNFQLNSSYGCDSAASCAGPAGAGATTADGFGGKLASSFTVALNGTDVAGVGFGSTGFYYLGTSVDDQGSATTAALKNAFSNATSLASWTLGSDGSVSYSIDGAGPSEVPLPAAVWLLGAGLAALGATARRRKGQSTSDDAMPLSAATA